MVNLPSSDINNVRDPEYRENECCIWVMVNICGGILDLIDILNR